MATTKINFDNLIIDRVSRVYFRDRQKNKLFAELSEVQNLSINSSAETKDKTDSVGTIIKRFFTSKSVEVSAESALLSLNLMGLQTGSPVLKDADVKDIPRVIHVAVPTDIATAIALPDVFSDVDTTTHTSKQLSDTLTVYGTFDNGLVDLDQNYTESVTVAVANDGKATITLPSAAKGATKSVFISYKYDAGADSNAIRVDQDAKSFPKECEAIFQILCAEKCDENTVYTVYVVFPRYQMSADFDWTVDTESAQPFSAIALKDSCARKQLLFYVVLDQSSSEYDAILDEDIDTSDSGNSGF